MRYYKVKVIGSKVVDCVRIDSIDLPSLFTRYNHVVSNIYNVLLYTGRFMINNDINNRIFVIDMDSKNVDILGSINLVRSYLRENIIDECIG